MTNADRQEAGRLHWETPARMWDDGVSAKRIAKWMGYKTIESWRTRKNQIRKKYPDWFSPRPQGFVPIDASW